MPLINVRLAKRDSTTVYMCGNDGSSYIRIFRSDNYGQSFTEVYNKYMPGYVIRGFYVFPNPSYPLDKTKDIFLFWMHKQNELPFGIMRLEGYSSNLSLKWGYFSNVSSTWIVNWGTFLLSSSNVLHTVLTARTGNSMHVYMISRNYGDSWEIIQASSTSNSTHDINFWNGTILEGQNGRIFVPIRVGDWSVNRIHYTDNNGFSLIDTGLEVCNQYSHVAGCVLGNGTLFYMYTRYGQNLLAYSTNNSSFTTRLLASEYANVTSCVASGNSVIFTTTACKVYRLDNIISGTPTLIRDGFSYYIHDLVAF